MIDAPPGQRLDGAGAYRGIRRWPTGAKVFLILSIALLPLALIGLFASLKTTEDANQGAHARLRIVAAESSRQLTGELIGDITALRAALAALEVDPANTPSCARAQGVFAQQAANGTRFAIYGADRRLLCGDDLPFVAPQRGDGIAAQIVDGQGLALSIAGDSGRSGAVAFFPISFLALTVRPSIETEPVANTIESESGELELTTLPGVGRLARVDRVDRDLRLGDLTLVTRARSAPITSPVIIAMLLPLLMWILAATIGWIVVDALLIRPLRRLRSSVATFRPGEVIDPGELAALPAQEIRDLGETFRTISATVAAHEAGLAEGLVRQTKLTREVHHRVKNNLQVVASLINFHARGAQNREVIDAYASIQRRVDALAVVHRHHFAELEESRGLSLRAVIGELASNIRATAPDEASKLAIAIEIEPFFVTQDVAIAVSFLVTELVEMAVLANPAAQIRISLRSDEQLDRAILRLSSPALIDGDGMRAAVQQRYGRVVEGLSRQLRSKLHYDPLAGVYEIAVAVRGRDR